MAAMVVVCAVVFFPVYWMLLSSIQPTEYSLSYPPPLYPKGFNWAAYAQLFAEKPIAHWLVISTFVAASPCIATLVFVIPAAYALSSLHWRGRSAFGLLLLFTQIMPAAIVVAPVLALYRSLAWTDNLVALAILHTAFVVPLCAWVLKSSFDGIPEGDRRGSVDRRLQPAERACRASTCRWPSPALSRSASSRSSRAGTNICSRRR